MVEQDIKAVIFDCDGVLVDSEIIASTIALELLKPLGFNMSLEEYAKAFAGKVERDTLNIIQNEYKITLPSEFLSQLRLKIEYALDNDLKAIKGVYDTIQSIDLPKAVVSNSRQVRVIHSLKVAGLADFFGENLFSSDMVEKPKPDPAIYLLAAQILGVRPEQCLVIEDSISGATSALRAGMNVIGFLGGSHIFNGHDSKLKETGVFATANDMNDLQKVINSIIN